MSYTISDPFECRCFLLHDLADFGVDIEGSGVMPFLTRFDPTTAMIVLRFMVGVLINPGGSCRRARHFLVPDSVQYASR